MLRFITQPCPHMFVLSRAPHHSAVGTCAGLGVPELDPASVSLLAEHGIDILPLEPLGAEVTGLDLRRMTADSELVAALTKEMAGRGYLVFRGQVSTCTAFISCIVKERSGLHL